MSEWDIVSLNNGLSNQAIRGKVKTDQKLE